MRIQSRIRRHVCVLFITKRILYGALWRRQRGGKAQKWSFASAFISRRRKRIYIRSAYCMKVQPLLVPMVPSISLNSAFFGALRPKSGCLSEKSDLFAFSGQSGANLASTGIIAQLQQAQVESPDKSSPESIDRGMAEIQAI